MGTTESQIREVFAKEDNECLTRPKVNMVKGDEVLEESNTNRQGWTRSLELLPNFDNEKLYSKLCRILLRSRMLVRNQRHFETKNLAKDYGKRDMFVASWLSLT